MSATLFTLKDAWIKDIEIMFGYLSMGMIFGVLLKASGFGVGYAAIMSVFIYSGVMQFLAISFFSGGFSLLNIFITTLMLNSRQSFYTLVMMPRLRNLGVKKFLNIFWLTDETFALLQSKSPHSRANGDLFMLFVGMLNYIYWICGCILGNLFGSLLRFDTKGLDFIMTAIFVAIFIDQWRDKRQESSVIKTPRNTPNATRFHRFHARFLRLRPNKSRLSLILGLIIGVFWLLLIGAQYFLICAIISVICVFLAIKPHLEAQ